uniref:3-phosphoinositide-dependent protein kinase 1 n=1 Tax=Rhabditophanes sp. KR3021 TaxID=114890 RepID=A0AC35U8N6_9BILA
MISTALQKAGQNKEVLSERTANNFYFLDALGEGAFSTVYLCVEVDTGQNYAIKVMRKEDITKKKKYKCIMREKAIMTILKETAWQCPFVATLYSTFQDDYNLFFAMTCGINGELLKHLRKIGCFDEETTRFYTAEILQALNFIHNQSVIHRDLKPENVILSGTWHILLADFGSARMLGDETDEEGTTHVIPARVILDEEEDIVDQGDPSKTKTPQRSSFVGTVEYISPEVVTGISFGPETDYWALGAMIYQMISGNPPFKGISEYKMLRKILMCDYSFPTGFPEDSKDLVRRLLVNDRHDRLGSQRDGGVTKLMQHKFFDNIDWDNLINVKPPQITPYLPASDTEPAFYSKKHFDNDKIKPGYDELNEVRMFGFDGHFEMFNLKTEEYEPTKLVDLNVPDELKGLTIPNEIVVREVDSPLKAMKLMFAKSEAHYDLLLEKQRTTNQYHRFTDNHLILKEGIIEKKKGLFARKRMFLLTDGPHLYYIDFVNMEYKGEIPWSESLETESKNFRTFFVHTPNRTYFLYDPNSAASSWCEAIDAVKMLYYPEAEKKKH